MIQLIGYTVLSLGCRSVNVLKFNNRVIVYMFSYYCVSGVCFDDQVLAANCSSDVPVIVNSVK